MYDRRAKARALRCAVCGGEFRSIRSDAKTCSSRCRKVRWLQSVKNSLPRSKSSVHEQICEVCLKEFRSRRSDTRTCSARCRKARSRSATGHLDRLKRMAATFDEERTTQGVECFSRRFFTKVFGDSVEHASKRRPRSKSLREARRETKREEDTLKTS